MRETAAGLAALGRGPDTMLVHMTPGEVQGLQALALSHGGSLTINPHTGLPEAGFLKDILPTIVGVGLTMMGVPAWGVGLGSGLTSLATGKDAGTALMSGLLAGGGAGMFGPGAAGTGEGAGALLNAGAATPGAYASTLGVGAEQAGQLAAQTGGFGLEGLTQTAASAGAQAPSYGATLAEGFKSAASDPMAFAKSNKMALGALGVGALNALGGFEQPALNTAMPQQERFTGKLSGPIRRPYDPKLNLYTDYGTLQPAYAAQGGNLDMKDGGFVVPADVVSHLGNGDTDAGLKALMSKTRAKPIKGQGDGMSDSIPASINGMREARVASGEAYLDRNEVARIGKGDQKRGSKKLYAMMDKVRKARTGTAKQGRQINPDRFVPA